MKNLEMESIHLIPFKIGYKDRIKSKKGSNLHLYSIDIVLKYVELVN